MAGTSAPRALSSQNASLQAPALSLEDVDIDKPRFDCVDCFEVKIDVYSNLGEEIVFTFFYLAFQWAVLRKHGPKICGEMKKFVLLMSFIEVVMLLVAIIITIN